MGHDPCVGASRRTLRLPPNPSLDRGHTVMPGVNVLHLRDGARTRPGLYVDAKLREG